MYFEEEEWCYRAKKNHYEIWYVPAAEIIHFGASSPLEKKDDIFDESMVLFYQRNIGVVKGVMITTLIILATLIDMCCVRVNLSNGRKPETLKRQLRQHRNIIKRLLTRIIHKNEDI
jgi:GT2 family glycosyltransferase